MAKNDLRLVRQGCRGRCPLLRRDLPDSAVGAVHHAPGDYPSGKKGDADGQFTVAGIPCLGLNGGPPSNTSEAFSFRSTDDQEETDRY
jgi:2-polyprenyl-6-hydroxyphenyl methylase/3-demethylubiquinone-9 3-methyltransferase